MSAQIPFGSVSKEDSERRVAEAIGHLVIVDVRGGYMVEDRDVFPALELTDVVPFAEARLAVLDALEVWARKVREFRETT